MAVQCVRRWLWCSCPAFHLSVVCQSYLIPSGIGSYRPSGKGCISRSSVLLSSLRVDSANYRQSQGMGICTADAECCTGGGRPLPQPLARWHFWVVNLNRKKNFLILKLDLLIILFCVTLVLYRCYKCNKYTISKLRGVKHEFLGKKPQLIASLADWNP